MSHNTNLCKINVDKNISKIVQFFLDKTTYEIIPFASCEGDSTAYISVIVRSNEAFLIILNLLFYEIYFKFERENTHDCISYTIRWDNKDTNKIIENIKNCEWLEFNSKIQQEITSLIYNDKQQYGMIQDDSIKKIISTISTI
ncbi:MAG: hypothetical protein M0R17_05515 [Candidatus Omnitrophica bacterium]|jgi:hypothetical protein|nr:hypothetical protein [Candidatus Omnitrophota bacterium]